MSQGSLVLEEAVATAELAFVIPVVEVTGTDDDPPPPSSTITLAPQEAETRDERRHENTATEVAFRLPKSRWRIVGA